MLKTPTTSLGKHVCTVTFIPDDLLMFKRSTNIMVRFKRFLTRSRMASQTHPRGKSILDSYYCYVLEHRKQLLHICVIHPFSNFYLIWQGIMTVVFYAQFLIIPLEVSLFEYHYQQSETQKRMDFTIRFVLDMTCLMDVILRFRVGYIDQNKQEVVLVPKRIALKYACGLFIFDLISSFTFVPHLISIHDKLRQRIKYLGLFKLFRVFTFATYCKYIGQFFKVSFMTHGLFMLISVYLLFVHVVTCLNIYVNTINENKEHELYYWRLEEVYDDYITNYGRSVYATLKMINYLDYGFHDLNNFNRTYMIIVWIICKIVYVWLISYIMKFVINRKTSSVMYMQLLRELKEYMRHKQLPARLQNRLMSYYEFHFQKCYFRESDVLPSMTKSLRDEINRHKCMKLVENVVLFRGMPSGLLIEIASCLRPQVYMINDVIFKYGSKGDCMYIIATGCVAVYGQKGNEVCHLKDGQFFGEVGLMARGIRYASIVAVEVTELYELYHKDFRTALEPYPAIYDQMVNMAEERKEAMKIIQMKNLIKKV
nr:potassium/sodium hyperpolarization-activated cyclic nucleotide-gated channel 1-like [Onthophagus taurus]